MALFTFKLPDIGEGISEAEIVGWHIQVGDRVEEDQPIADMMTDKATVEMESPVAGVVVRLAGEPGDQVPIGSMLVEIEVEGDVAAAPPPSDETLNAQTPVEPVIAEAAAPDGSDAPAKTGAQGSQVPPLDLGLLPSQEQEVLGQPILASPAVRARAKELGIDLAQVKPAADRIRHADLDAYLLYGAGQGYAP